MTDHLDTGAVPFGLLPHDCIGPSLRELLLPFQFDPRDIREARWDQLSNTRDLQDRSCVHGEWQRWDLSLNSVLAFGMPANGAASRRDGSHGHDWVADQVRTADETRKRRRLDMTVGERDPAAARIAQLGALLRGLAQRLVDSIREVPEDTPVHVFFSILGVQPGAPRQPRHQDLAHQAGYFTALFPLTQYAGQGGTMFDGAKRPPDGAAYYFDGSTWHWGTANDSDFTRYVLMAVVMPDDAPGDDNRRATDTPVRVTKHRQARVIRRPSRYAT